MAAVFYTSAEVFTVSRIWANLSCLQLTTRAGPWDLPNRTSDESVRSSRASNGIADGSPHMLVSKPAAAQPHSQGEFVWEVVLPVETEDVSVGRLKWPVLAPYCGLNGGAVGCGCAIGSRSPRGLIHGVNV